MSIARNPTRRQVFIARLSLRRKIRSGEIIPRKIAPARKVLVRPTRTTPKEKTRKMVVSRKIGGYGGIDRSKYSYEDFLSSLTTETTPTPTKIRRRLTRDEMNKIIEQVGGRKNIRKVAKTDRGIFVVSKKIGFRR